MEDDRYKRIDNKMFLTPKSAVPATDINKLSDEKKAYEDPPERGYFDGAKNDRYLEETATEIAAPRYYNGMRETKLDTHHDRTDGVGFGGTLVGTIALIVSILSLFMMPFLLGIIGIIGGFISRSKGAKSLGSWAIGIGVVSIIVGIVILPFF